MFRLSGYLITFVLEIKKKKKKTLTMTPLSEMSGVFLVKTWDETFLIYSTHWLRNETVVG